MNITHIFNNLPHIKILCTTPPGVSSTETLLTGLELIHLHNLASVQSSPILQTSLRQLPNRPLPPLSPHSHVFHSRFPKPGRPQTHLPVGSCQCDPILAFCRLSKMAEPGNCCDKNLLFFLFIRPHCKICKNANCSFNIFLLHTKRLRQVNFCKGLVYWGGGCGPLDTNTSIAWCALPYNQGCGVGGCTF